MMANLIFSFSVIIVLSMFSSISSQPSGMLPSSPGFPVPTGISPAPPGFPLDVMRPRRVRCRLPFFPDCYKMSFECPLRCPFTCLIDCTVCKPVCTCDLPSSVCQDPRFVGGDGNVFYFHGRKDEDFCLVSDNDYHINAHFIGKRNPNLTRDFTWVQSIGAIFDSHKLLIAAKRVGKWDENVDHLRLSLNGVSVNLPTGEGFTWHSTTKPRVSITRNSPTNKVEVEIEGKFKVNAAVVPITEEESRVHKYNITDEDCFAHLELGFKFYNMSSAVDGILGQTYKPDYVSKAKPGAVMPVMGGTHKFLSSGLFTTDCGVSRFGLQHGSSDRVGIANADGSHASVTCTNMPGAGMVCKK